jgi:hypothetical protein
MIVCSMGVLIAQSVTSFLEIFVEEGKQTKIEESHFFHTDNQHFSVTTHECKLSRIFTIYKRSLAL